MSDQDDEWTVADEWASWMFPELYFPRFEDLPKVRATAHTEPTLPRDIQEFIDEVNPPTAVETGPWIPDFRASTPGVGVEDQVSRFKLTVDKNIVGTFDAERDQVDWDGVDLGKAAEELKRNAPDSLLDEVHIHPSVYPGEARTLAEGEALVGTHPKHETLEELPGPCIMCGEDEVYVTVRRNPDGEIEHTKLKCQECGWRVTGGPQRFDEDNLIDRPDGEVDWQV